MVKVKIKFRIRPNVKFKVIGSTGPRVVSLKVRNNDRAGFELRV